MVKFKIKKDKKERLECYTVKKIYGQYTWLVYFFPGMIYEGYGQNIVQARYKKIMNGMVYMDSS